MTTQRWKWGILALCLGIGLAPAAAQATCPELVQEALAATDEYCQAAERNEACYGNVSIDAELAEGLSFEQQGDIVPLEGIQRLTLAGLDTDEGTWGVTLMRLQADIPESMPGSNVTFLLFGDVEIENAAAGEPGLTPMQAFYFKSGVGSPDCQEAPDGILVQTPEGVAEVNFTVNGANVSLGSTAFFQTRLSDEGKPPSLTMSVLEGQGTIEAFGVTQPVFAGSWVRVPIDEDFNVAAAPGLPKPYQFGEDDLGVLPVDQLETSFEPAQSLSQEQIDNLLATIRIDNSVAIHTQALVNDLPVAVTIRIPGTEEFVLGPGETRTLELSQGMYRLTACTDLCATQRLFVNATGSAHITKDTFAQAR